MIGYTVIGGFLGSGKTTLINAVLANATERIAVVVNDIGEINIDAALVASASEDAIELTNGCVCCSIGASLASTLRDLCLSDQPPDRIVVECSGAAEPGRVAAYGNRRVMDPAGVLVVVDATDVRQRAVDRRFGALVRSQLAAADLIAVSKTDLVDDAEAAAVSAWLAEAVDVPVVSGPPAELGAVLPAKLGAGAVEDPLRFGGTAQSQRSVPTGGRPLEHTTGFRTVTIDVVSGTTLDEIASQLTRVDGLVRAKGVVEADVGPTLVQWAAGRIQTSPWTGAALPSALVVITA